MQSLTGPPREHLTADQVRELLTGQDVRRDHGLELVDEANQMVEDLSDDCRGWSVTYSSGDGSQIHGALSTTLTRELRWGTARVRPYMTLARDVIEGEVAHYEGANVRKTVAAKFYAGVYVLTTPNTQHGRSPIVYTVNGRNLLQSLDRQVPDTHVIASGTTYLQALRDVVAAAGLSIPLHLDGTRQDAALPEDRVWLIGDTRWIDICNDLLAEIAYTDLWCDERGNFRASPVVPLEQRPVEWTFDTSDEFTDLVAASYTEAREQDGAYNMWRFVRDDMAYQPVEGDGLFTYGPPDGTPTADVRPAPLQSLRVADQEALEAEGLRIIAADQRTEHTFSLQVDPLPIAGHRDVVKVRSAGRQFTMQVTSWTLTPYTKGSWTLGGGTGGRALEPDESAALATVTQASASGLRVVIDGATTDSAATALTDDSATTPTFDIGTRVRVRARNPFPPIVEGKES